MFQGCQNSDIAILCIHCPLNSLNRKPKKKYNAKCDACDAIRSILGVPPTGPRSCQLLQVWEFVDQNDERRHDHLGTAKVQSRL